MRWYERLIRIDRRVIYLLLTVLVIAPFFVPLRIPENIMPQTRRLFDFIEAIPAQDKAVLMSFDYTPSTQPECHPMAIALLQHCFRRHLPVIGISYEPQGPGMAVDALMQVSREINEQAQSRCDSVIYGEDYVYLGWKSGRVAAMLEMGERITGVYPVDYFQHATDSLPLMRRIRNYRDIAIAVIITAAAYPDEWVMYPQARYGVKVAAGLTAVMAPEYYPFLQTGQFSGMISGMKGAAEYEKLILEHGYARRPGRAETGMNSQSMIHLLIIIFIVIGNIGYFFAQRAQK